MTLKVYCGGCGERLQYEDYSIVTIGNVAHPAIKVLPCERCLELKQQIAPLEPEKTPLYMLAENSHVAVPLKVKK